MKRTCSRQMAGSRSSSVDWIIQWIALAGYRPATWLIPQLDRRFQSGWGLLLPQEVDGNQSVPPNGFGPVRVRIISTLNFRLKCIYSYAAKKIHNKVEWHEFDHGIEAKVTRNFRLRHFSIGFDARPKLERVGSDGEVGLQTQPRTQAIFLIT